VKDVADRSLFDKFPCIHYNHPICHLGNYAEIMGDKDNCRIKICPQLFQQFENLGLDGDIQGSAGLVRKEQLWIARQGHGNENPLLHAPGKMMGIISQAPFRHRNAHQLQHIYGPLFYIPVLDILMQPDCLANLVANGQDRVEGRHGFLKDHGHLVAPEPTHFSLTERQDILVVKKDLSTDLTWRRWHQAHY
jgi:hypothetical protein